MTSLTKWAATVVLAAGSAALGGCESNGASAMHPDQPAGNRETAYTRDPAFGEPYQAGYTQQPTAKSADEDGRVTGNGAFGEPPYEVSH